MKITAMLNTTIAHYKVTAKLGQGGMGEVYRATDTKLGREVAIKVLPASFATDKERLARFEREARALAQLNHSHIAGVYDFDQSEGQWFLAMELIEGEDLSYRLHRGPLLVEEALEISKQIAEALEAAHEKGIIHRDLKPANVKLTEDVQVKVLDFGLAKTADSDTTGSSAADSMSPTITADHTLPGTILGTAAYMSPEQARGKAVDKRSDIWSFGCVLFECLTGKRIFQGEDTTEILAAIIKGEPDWTALPENTPPTVHLLLRKCLAKDRKRRLPDIAAARIDLEEAIADPSSSFVRLSHDALQETTAKAGTKYSLIAGLALVAVTAAFVWFLKPDRPTEQPVSRLLMRQPADRALYLYGAPRRSIAISPDGATVAFVALNPTASRGSIRNRLYVQSLDSLESQPLEGTEGALQPFFSPDGQWVAFFTRTAERTGELKKVYLRGGRPQTLINNLSEAMWTFGTWLKDNTIVIGTFDGLQRISADGGSREDLAISSSDDGDRNHFFPQAVEDTESVLFEARGKGGRQGGSRIEALQLDTGKSRVILPNAGSPQYLASGHLLFKRGGNFLAAPFDSETMTVRGPYVSVMDAVHFDRIAGEIAVSRNGTMIYVPAVDTSRVIIDIVSRSEEPEPLGTPPANIRSPRVSPNGMYVAYIVDSEGEGPELQLYEIERGVPSRLPLDGSVNGLAWRPDSLELAVSLRESGREGIFLVDLSGAVRPLVNDFSGRVKLGNWSGDGQELVYTQQNGQNHDIWILTMDPKPSVRPLIDSSFSEYNAVFSPDGQWLAYVSNESSQYEVYIQGYPEGEKHRVSIDGGSNPLWSAGGSEVFFAGSYENSPYVMSVSIAEISKGPTPVFPLRVTGPTGIVEQYSIGSNRGTDYDIFPDGRFVMVRRPDPEGTRDIVVVQNWFNELKKLAPTNK